MSKEREKQNNKNMQSEILWRERIWEEKKKTKNKVKRKKGNWRERKERQKPKKGERKKTRKSERVNRQGKRGKGIRTAKERKSIHIQINKVWEERISTQKDERKGRKKSRREKCHTKEKKSHTRVHTHTHLLARTAGLWLPTSHGKQSQQIPFALNHLLRNGCSLSPFMSAPKSYIPLDLGRMCLTLS